jgi:hypothetical protein
MDIFMTNVHADHDPSDGEPKSVSRSEHIANEKKQPSRHSKPRTHDSIPVLSR